MTSSGRDPCPAGSRQPGTRRPSGVAITANFSGTRRPGCRRARRTGRRCAISSSWRADLDDAGAVEHDDEVGHAHGGEAVRHQDRDAAVVGRRRARAGGVALEQRVLGLGVERRGRLVEHQQQRLVAHEAARQRELLPLAERDLDAARARSGRAACRARRPAGRPRRRRRRGRPRPSTAGSSSSRGTSPRPTRVAGAELEAEEVLERAGQPRAPLVGRHARQSAPSTRIAPGGRLVELGQQLHQRASCRRRSRRRSRRPRRPAASSVTSSSTSRVGAGIGERHVLEADAVAQPRPARARSACGDERRGVVLEPGQPARAVHPDAAQEADLADGRADVRRQPRAGGEHEQHVARRRVEPDGDEHDRADVRRRRRPPTPACATRAEPQRAAATGPYQRSHAARRCGDQPVADAGDAHLLAGRRRGRDGEQVAGQPVGRRAALLRARARRAGRHVEVSTVGSAKTREQHERRVDRHRAARR